MSNVSNAELNQRMYALVRAWCGQASLAISGVNLADCMAYDALSVIGRQIINAPDTAGGATDDAAKSAEETHAEATV